MTIQRKRDSPDVMHDLIDTGTLEYVAQVARLDVAGRQERRSAELVDVDEVRVVLGLVDEDLHDGHRATTWAR